MSESGNNVVEETPEHRADWLATHSEIETAYTALLKELKRIPTVTEIYDHIRITTARPNGVAENTIYRHLKELDLSKFTDPAKIHNGKIIAALAARAEEGNERAVKLFMQIVNGWTEKVQQEVTGKDGAPLQTVIILPANGRESDTATAGATD